jgi:dephospho-CoA kinase
MVLFSSYITLAYSLQTSPWSREDGNSFTSRTNFWLEEISRGIFVMLPVCLAAGLSARRLALRRHRPLRWMWSLLASAVLGDLLLELWLPVPGSSWQCSVSDPDHQSWLRYKMFQFLGLQCSLPVSVLYWRLCFMTVGAYLGHLFVPVALTGSIATGKSTVVKSLTSSPSSLIPFSIIDTDTIGHEILLPPLLLEEQANNGAPVTITPSESVYFDIVRCFGDKDTGNKNIVDDDGRIDRRKIGAIIFQDPRRRRDLNRITHPRIISIMLKRLLARIYSLSTQRMIVCADVPLLFESGTLTWLFALAVVVACQPDQQYHRLRKRNADLTEEQCRDRIASQIPIENKVALADVTIMNDCSLDDLATRVTEAREEIEKRLFGVNLAVWQYTIIMGSLVLFKIKTGSR